MMRTPFSTSPIIIRYCSYTLLDVGLVESKVSFVYFDLGGVVAKDFSEKSKWEELREEWGIAPDKEEEFEAFWHDRDLQICSGRIALSGMIPTINERFGSKIPQDRPVLDDFVNKFEQNRSIWPVIRKIKKISRIGLLTNMYPGMLSAIQKGGFIPNVEWDAIVDSSIEGCVKPEKRIFEVAERKALAKGKDILFVDNILKNITAANEFGWQTFLYDAPNYEEASRELSESLL